MDYFKGERNMRIRLAHLRDQGINFAVFAADAKTPSNSERNALLERLTHEARLQGLKIDKSALAFDSCGRTQFFGTPDLVKYLARFGIRGWTHTIEV